MPLKLDGWMTCDVTSFSTVPVGIWCQNDVVPAGVFQSYRDDERLIMKGCV